MRWTIAGIAGASAVALGAFGAHGLEGRVEPELIEIWETGARYHLAHAVVLLVLATVPERGRYAVPLFCAGLLLFSGSLYLMTLTGVRMLGAITPLGGLCLIAGWIAVARG